MSFAKPSWIAAALVGAENAACVVAVTSQTVSYPTPEGPFTTDVPVRNDRTPFQMTALHTAVGVLVFADQRPLGWFAPGVEIDDYDWPTIAMRHGLNPPETSPVPMGLDVVAPMTEPDPAPDFADVVRSMEKVSGADLSHLNDNPPPGLRADQTHGPAGSTGTSEPFAIVLVDHHDPDFSNLYLCDDAIVLARIMGTHADDLDDVLFAAAAGLRATSVDVLGHSTWMEAAEAVIAAAHIPPTLVLRGSYA